MTDVLVEKQGAIAVVTLNRPDAMNSLTPDMLVRLAEAFTNLSQDPEIRCAILTGSGEKAFTAGIDLTKAGNVFQGKRPPASKDPRTVIEAFPWPVIGAINGFAVTGGFELALCCDILIGSTNAKFADTHAKFGIAPSWGLSQKLSRLIGSSRAKEMHFSARFVSSSEALSWGLLNRVVSPHELMPTCMALATQITQMEPGMLRRYKRTVDRGLALPFGEACQMEMKDAYEYYQTMTPEQFGKMKTFIASRGRKQSKL